MAKKKKKMSKSQAAAARREPTVQATAKKRAKESANKNLEIQKAEKEKSAGFKLLAPVIAIAAIIICAALFTVLPGACMGK